MKKTGYLRRPMEVFAGVEPEFGLIRLVLHPPNDDEEICERIDEPLTPDAARCLGRQLLHAADHSDMWLRSRSEKGPGDRSWSPVSWIAPDSVGYCAACDERTSHNVHVEGCTA